MKRRIALAAVLWLAAFAGTRPATADSPGLDPAGMWSATGSEDPSRRALTGNLTFSATGQKGVFAVAGSLAWDGSSRFGATGKAQVVARQVQLDLTLVPEGDGVTALPTGTGGGGAGPGASEALDSVGVSGATGAAPTAGASTGATNAAGTPAANAGAAAAARVPVTLSTKMSLLRDGRPRLLQGRWRMPAGTGTPARTGVLKLTRGHRESFSDFVARSWDKIDFTQYGYKKDDGRIEVDCADTFLILISLYANENGLDLLMASGSPLKSFRLSTYLKKYGPDGIRRFTAQVCAWFGTFNVPDFGENLGGDFRVARVGDVLFKPSQNVSGQSYMGHTTLLVGYWTKEELEQQVPAGSSYRADFDAGVASGTFKPYLFYKIFASTVGWSAPQIKDIDARNRYIGHEKDEDNYLHQVRRVRESLFSARAGTP
ncbi:MAG: hypothetical protein HYZ53_19575 [Planctomycetes bacterium]|nr:hypothetical protein [Planctomycetota bacterium]